MKEIKIYTLALICSLFLYVFYVPMYFILCLIIIWGVFFAQIMMFNKVSFKEIIPLASIILLKILHRNLLLVNLHEYVILIIYFSIVDAYYLKITSLKYKIIKEALLVIFVVSFCIGNLLYYNHKIIKDKGLEICISNEIEGIDSNNKIDVANLKLINTLVVDNKYFKVYDLDGIKYLKKLRDINFKNIGKMKNIDQLSTLNNVKNVSIAKGDPSMLLENVKFNNLSRLSLNEVNINNIGEITNNIPNIKSIYLMGVQLNDLAFVKDCKSIEYIELFDCEINSLKSIDTLSNLKTLKICNCNINDDTKLKDLNNVEIYR